MLHFKIPSKGRIVVCLLITLVFSILLGSCKNNTAAELDKIPLVGKYHYSEQYTDDGLEEIYEIYLTITQNKKDKLKLELTEKVSSKGKSREETGKFEDVETTSPTSFFTQQTITFVDEDGFREPIVYKIRGELRGSSLYLTVDGWDEGHPEDSSPEEYVMTRIE